MTPDEQTSLTQTEPAIEEQGATDGRGDLAIDATPGLLAEDVGEPGAELNDASALPVSIAPYHDGSDASSPSTEAQDAPATADAPTNDAGDDPPGTEVTDNQDTSATPSEDLSAQDGVDPGETGAIAPPAPASKVELPFQATWVLHKLQALADEAPLQAGESGFDGLRERLMTVAADAVKICLQRTEGLSQADAFVAALATQGWINPEHNKWSELTTKLEQVDADAILASKQEEIQQQQIEIAAAKANLETLHSQRKRLVARIAVARQRKHAIDDEIKAYRQQREEEVDEELRIKELEQEEKLKRTLAKKQEKIDEQQRLLDELVKKKKFTLADLQSQRTALQKEIADLKQGKAALTSSTAVTSLQQSEMEQLRSTNKTLAERKVALEQEVARLRFYENRLPPTEGTPSSGTVGAGWQKLFEALKLTQKGLIYQVKHAISEAEAVATEARRTGDRQLEREANDMITMWRPWYQRNSNDWDTARTSLTNGLHDQALEYYEKMYNDGVRGANKLGEIEQPMADALDAEARVTWGRIITGPINRRDTERMRSYSEQARLLMSVSKNQVIRSKVEWIPKYYGSWASKMT